MTARTLDAGTLAGAKISKLEAAVYILAQRLQLAGIETAIPASEIDAATLALAAVRHNRAAPGVKVQS